jgi:hypothetical protein
VDQDKLTKLGLSDFKLKSIPDLTYPDYPPNTQGKVVWLISTITPPTDEDKANGLKLTRPKYRRDVLERIFPHPLDVVDVWEISFEELSRCITYLMGIEGSTSIFLAVVK